MCACFDVMISHGWPAKLPHRCSFFLSVLSFLFSFSFFFFTMLLALSVFLLTRTNVELKSYNLNRFAKPTRCHPFNSFLQQTGDIICMVVILFATRGSTPLKKWSWWRNEVANLLLKLLHDCCERQGRKFQALRETKNTWNFFVVEPIAAPSACSFLPGAVNLAKPSWVKYLFLLSALSRKSPCSNDAQFQPAC